MLDNFKLNFEAFKDDLTPKWRKSTEKRLTRDWNRQANWLIIKDSFKWLILALPRFIMWLRTKVPGNPPKSSHKSKRVAPTNKGRKSKRLPKLTQFREGAFHWLKKRGIIRFTSGAFTRGRSGRLARRLIPQRYSIRATSGWLFSLGKKVYRSLDHQLTVKDVLLIILSLLLLWALFVKDHRVIASPEPLKTTLKPAPPPLHVKIPKKAPQVHIAVQTPVARAVQAPSVVPGCGDNSYANFIYMHESGCNTGAVNYLGCFGIGQDCNGVLKEQCGTNYSCQNAFFTKYSQKYGGWLGSYNFWLANSWW